MEKVLIVGANGYFGSELIKFLKDKNIYCEGTDINYFKDCDIFKTKKFKIKELCASKLTESYLKKFTSIIGFAGYSNNPVFKKEEKNFHKKEFRYLKRIAKTCKKYSIKFIFPSSCSLYGASKTKKLINEKGALNPITHYSKNKKEVEKYLIRISNNKFRPIIMRFSTLYGLSQKMRFDIVINMFCGCAVSTKKIELNSDGKVYRPFIEISDACNAIYKVIKNNKKFDNQIFNIGSNEDNIKILSVAKMIKNKVKNSKIIFLKKEKKLVSDNIIKKGKDKRNYKVNFSSFKRTFSYKTKYNLDKGISKLIKDLKKIKLNEQTFNSTKFYRLQYLENLYNKKFINKKMEFLIKN